MKKLLLFILIILCCRDAVAQKIIERKNKIIGNVTERLQTYIEGDKQIKNGTYRAFFNRKVLLASGKYDHDKKVGIWHYFNDKGKLMQNFDFDANKLLYEDPEEDNSGFKYRVDDTIRDADKVTQPVRIGGRYFGYAPYVRLFKPPTDFTQQTTVSRYVATFELLISPMGRLADLQVHLQYGPTTEDKAVYPINIDQLSDDDKQFIPATFNLKPISSRISFACIMDAYGVVDLY